MAEDISEKVDDYVEKMVVDQDNALVSTLKDSHDADLSKINASHPCKVYV